MATIVVEDGTGLTNSNSYMSEAELTTYATDRGVTLSGAAAVLLIQGMDYIETQSFKGVKNSEAQALQWPRYGVIVDNYELDTTAIPDSLKSALAETAIAIDGGSNPLANVGRATKREKADVIEVEYMDGTRDTVYLAAVQNKLKKLLASGAGGITGLAIRG